jgi:hypothetical protein
MGTVTVVIVKEAIRGCDTTTVDAILDLLNEYTLVSEQSDPWRDAKRLTMSVPEMDDGPASIIVSHHSDGTVTASLKRTD